MKKIILLSLVCIACVFTANAKDPIKFDFENGLPASISKHCADAAMAGRYLDAAIVNNPQTTGNPSAKALKYEQINGLTQWQGFKMLFDTPIPLSSIATDSITHVTVKFYEAINNISTTAGNLSVKLLLSWKGEYVNATGDKVLAEGQLGGNYGTEVGPDIIAVPPVTNHAFQTWNEVKFPFTPNFWTLYKEPYKEIVGIAVSPVRAMGYTPDGSAKPNYIIYVDDITIHFKSGATSIKTTGIAPEELNVSVNGDLATISFNSPVATHAEVSIYNISGQIISQQAVNCVEGLNFAEAFVPEKGVYVVKVKTNNGTIASKFVK